MLVDVFNKIPQEERQDALFEILLQRGELFYKILGFKSKWNEQLTFKLITDSRVFQNTEVARIQNLLYSPSVKRTREDEFIFEKFNDMLKRYGHERLAGIKIPSISDYLKDRSRGCPSKLLEETLILREKATPIRLYLTSHSGLLTNFNNVSNKTIIQLNNLSKEIFDDLPQINTQTVIGVRHDMSGYSDLSALSNTFDNQQYTPQYRCFTQIARALADNINYQTQYDEILKNNCIEKP
jgi:hypothetical protein